MSVAIRCKSAEPNADAYGFAHRTGRSDVNDIECTSSSLCALSAVLAHFTRWQKAQPKAKGATCIVSMDSAIVWTATAVGFSLVVASVFNWTVKKRVKGVLKERASASVLASSTDGWPSPMGISPHEVSRGTRIAQKLIRLGPDPSTSVEIRPAEATAVQAGVPLDRETLTRWSPLLSAVIDMARTAAIARSDLYTLTFSKASLAGLADGTFTAVGAPDGVRSWIVDAHTGRFVEHGVLHSATLIKAAAVAGTAWRILAVVTAQKFLADINRQLASMKVALEEIRQHLEQDRAAKLVGNLVYLRETAAAIAVGRISERERQALTVQIEAIDRESTQLSSAFEGTLNVQLSRLTALNDDAKGSRSLPTSEVWDQIIAGISRIEQYLQALISAMLGRLIANEQSLMLDEDSHLAGQRRDNIEQAIRTLAVTKDDAHNRVRLKLDQIRQGIGDRRLEVGTRGKSRVIGELVLGPILAAPLLVKDLIEQRQLNEASRRLEEALDLFRRDSATTDNQLAALRAEYSFSGAIWGTKNANIHFIVGLSGGDGEIGAISIELVEI